MKTLYQFLFESTPPFNLRNIFDDLNRRMFDEPRRLPLIPISFGSLPKGVAGITQYRYNRSTRMIVPGSMYIKVSPLVTTENALDAVIAHEILHARFALDGDVYENHGSRFVSLAKTMSDRLGFVVPINHEFSVDDLSAVPRKRVAAFINHTSDGKISFSLISDTKASEVMSHLEKWARMRIQSGVWKSSWFGLIDTRLYKLYTVSRTAPKSNYIFNKNEIDKFGSELEPKITQFFHIQ